VRAAPGGRGRSAWEPQARRLFYYRRSQMVPVVSRQRGILFMCAAILACAGIALSRPAPADAHAFLINSSPLPGARLARPPQQLTLQFSEAVVSSAVRISVRTADGSRVSLPHPLAHGSVVDQPFPAGLRGIYVVSWQVVSADDGHLTDGEFAFAAAATGALPKVSTSSTPIGWGQAFACWWLFAGLALGVCLHFVRDVATGGTGVPLFWPADRHSDVRAPYRVYYGLLVGAAAAAAGVGQSGGPPEVGDRGLADGAWDHAAVHPNQRIVAEYGGVRPAHHLRASR